MLTKNEIIEQWFRQGVVQEIVKKVSRGAKDAKFDDLVQIIYLNLLEKDEGIIRDLYESGQYRFYIARMVMIQSTSNKSYFFYDDRKFSSNSSELDFNKVSETKNEVIYQIEELMKDLPKEDIEWIEDYLELGSKVEVAKKRGYSEHNAVIRINSAINKLRRAYQTEKIKAEYGISQE